MTQKKPAANSAAEKAKALKAAREYHLGRYRYLKVEDGVTQYLPEYMGSPFYKTEGLEREICYDVDENLNPQWKHAPDAPFPAGSFAQNPDNVPGAPSVAPSPPFDYVPPAYASDTMSGGPANFHGAKGGNDNPRDPRLEGEIPGDAEAKLAQFRETLSLNGAK